MWSFIQEAQKTVFDVIAPALGPEGEIETAVLNGDMGVPLGLLSRIDSC